jgi:hypothetical protein
MRFVLTDYSPIYYRTLSREDLPAARSGKFVQIRNRETEYLLLSPRDFSAYHANIAERFFSGQDIEGTYNGKRDHFAIHASGWEIIGGGMWAINDRDKILHLSGSSHAYGRFDGCGLREKILSQSEMAEYTIRID